MHEEYDNEIWKDIDSYEGIYQISNYGRVKSCERIIINSKGVSQLIQERIMSPGSTGNYLYVSLRKDGKSKNYYVHRLVASAFIDNPMHFEEVNHKDENKLNNYYNNLEWCDRKYNVNYGTIKERVAQTLGIPIKQYSLDGQFIKYWESAQIAADELNEQRSNINYCCRHPDIYKTVHNSFWRYADDEFVMPIATHIKAVVQYDDDMNIIEKYRSISEAARATGVNNTSISQCCRGELKHAGKYKWKYVYDI